MKPSEFDKFADEYRALHEANLTASGEAPEYFAEYKMKDLRRLIGEAAPGMEGGRFLDFGGGVGTAVPFFRKHIPRARLTCVDMSLKSLEVGATRFGEHTRFVAFDGVQLPFAEASFDGAFAACVFHHIPPDAHEGLFTELRRVLKPGGLLMIYEHNPLNPLTVRAVNACPFDENAILIRASVLRTRVVSSGFREARTKYRVFFPRSLRWLRAMESKLGWLPMGAQYFVFGRK
jgi:ubiquinone/menaquinone biosynthesis C-methylase UbiE